MEREYQRPIPQPRATEPLVAPAVANDAEVQRKAFKEFVLGLQTMSTDFGRLVFNFGQAAALIAGDLDAPARIRGMMEFAAAYHQFGLETAMDAIGDHSGVRVDMISGTDRGPARVTPAIVVGLLGAHESLPTGERSFDGVAMVEDARGRERFVAVSIRPDGHTQLHRDQYDFYKPDLISDKPIDEIFPPANKRSHKSR
jgi:hypothetical protein